MKNETQSPGARPAGRAVSEFFSGIGDEFKRITWPHGRELFESTLVVLAFIAILSATVFVFDKVVGQALGLLLG